MTPVEQKAQELLNTFQQVIHPMLSRVPDTRIATQCAILCVNEILSLKLWGKTNGINDSDFWNEVKAYLIKLIKQ